MTLIINNAWRVLVCVRENKLQITSGPSLTYKNSEMVLDGIKYCLFGQPQMIFSLCLLNNISVNNSSVTVEQNLLQDNFLLSCNNMSRAWIIGSSNNIINNCTIKLLNSDCYIDNCNFNNLTVENILTPSTSNDNDSNDCMNYGYFFARNNTCIENINYRSNSKTLIKLESVKCDALQLTLSEENNNTIFENAEISKIVVETICDNTLDLSNTKCCLVCHTKQIKITQTNCEIEKIKEIASSLFGVIPKYYSNISFIHY